MKKISKKRLLALGFEAESTSRYWKGDIFINIQPKDTLMTVYVSARITSSEDYARPALGVKNEKDLLELCSLVNAL